MSSSTFVLISGGWHSSACWQRVVPLLEAQGHRVLTPELLGMGEDPTPLSQINLASWADQVANIIQNEEKAVILLGHSRSGLIISEVAERVPEKIRLLVYLSAFLLPSGESLAGSTSDTDNREWVVIDPTGTITLVPDKIVPVFYNTTAPEWTERVPSLISPEPITTIFTSLNLTDDRFGRVPRAYIECKQDNSLPLTKQHSMQARLPCKYVTTMDTDHSPFFSAPSELVAHLIELATKQ